MVSFSEAKNIIKYNTTLLSPIKMELDEALGYVLAEEVYAPCDVPAFHQSAMDGYAFCFQDYLLLNKLKVNGMVQAGLAERPVPLHKQAARIFTGAPVPEGADTVVMQEKVKVQNGELVIEDPALKEGGNVRLKGSEVKAGSLVLRAGTYLTPPAVGFLASLGVHEVFVHPMPKVTLIITGNELQQPGSVLLPGQVYECNSFALKAALKQLQVTGIKVVAVPDQLISVQTALDHALRQSDLILLTGGVSVGDFDFVQQAASLCGVNQLFYKVKQKPGKPLYFGKKEDKLVFGLPGNPASVLTCFYEFVVDALEGLSGRKEIIKRCRRPLATGVQKKEGVTLLLKGWCTAEEVRPLDAQESYRLSSFAQANCLILLKENRTEYKKGELVKVHLLPS